MTTIVICDICGDRENVTRDYYTTGSNSLGETEGEFFDLCPSHKIAVLEELINRHRTKFCLSLYEVNHEIVRIIKAVIQEKTK